MVGPFEGSLTFKGFLRPGSTGFRTPVFSAKDGSLHIQTGNLRDGSIHTFMPVFADETDFMAADVEIPIVNVSDSLQFGYVSRQRGAVVATASGLVSLMSKWVDSDEYNPLELYDAFLFLKTFMADFPRDLKTLKHQIDAFAGWLIEQDLDSGGSWKAAEYVSHGLSSAFAVAFARGHNFSLNELVPNIIDSRGVMIGDDNIVTGPWCLSLVKGPVLAIGVGPVPVVNLISYNGRTQRPLVLGNKVFDRSIVIEACPTARTISVANASFILLMASSVDDVVTIHAIDLRSIGIFIYGKGSKVFMRTGALSHSKNLFPSLQIPD